MNTKLAFGGILLIAAMAAVVHWHKQHEASLGQPPDTRQNIESPPASSIKDSLDEQTKQDIKQLAQRVADSGGDIDPLLLAARQLYGAESAVAVERALDDLAMIEPDLADGRRIELTRLCNPAVIESLGTSNAHVGTLLRRFCRGFDWQKSHDSVERVSYREGDIDAVSEPLSRNPMMRFETSLEKRIASSIEAAPEFQRADTYEELLRNAQFPEEIFLLISHNAQHANDHSGQLLWAFGQEIQEMRYPEASLLNAQEVALTLYACRRFGGCRSNQFFGMTYCIGFRASKCRAGSTVEDMLYQVTSPADFGLAMEILARL